jgi:hypothetical protein
MKALVMVGSTVRRLARDRLALLFIVLLPLVIILIIGVTFGDGGSNRLPVAIVEQDPGPLASRLRAELEASPALDPRAYEDQDALRKAVRRGVVAAGLVVPAGYDQALRAGRQAEVTFVVDQTRPAPAPVRSAVAAVVARQAATVRAAQFTSETAGVPFDTALARARALSAGQERVRVEATTIGGREDPLPTGFNYTAPANLVLTRLGPLQAVDLGSDVGRSLAFHDLGGGGAVGAGVGDGLLGCAGRSCLLGEPVEMEAELPGHAGGEAEPRQRPRRAGVGRERERLGRVGELLGRPGVGIGRDAGHQVVGQGEVGRHLLRHGALPG